MSGKNEDFISLFHVWQYLQNGMEQDKLQDTSDVTMRHQNKPPTPSRKDSEVPTVTHDREEKMAADHDGN